MRLATVSEKKQRHLHQDLLQLPLHLTDSSHPLRPCLLCFSTGAVKHRRRCFSATESSRPLRPCLPCSSAGAVEHRRRRVSPTDSLQPVHDLSNSSEGTDELPNIVYHLRLHSQPSASPAALTAK
ncbi:hypothetical protein PUN28_010877 [Cardiocondyla obscurior]|uniref:Uncharacterized protein n=1 Tax=Cardiocondyla obscurior TaxID=286306 RepID=A0AAW2FK77_9HYME